MHLYNYNYRKIRSEPGRLHSTAIHVRARHKATLHNCQQQLSHRQETSTASGDSRRPHGPSSLSLSLPLSVTSLWFSRFSDQTLIDPNLTTSLQSNPSVRVVYRHIHFYTVTICHDLCWWQPVQWSLTLTQSFSILTYSPPVTPGHITVATDHDFYRIFLPRNGSLRRVGSCEECSLVSCNVINDIHMMR